MVKLSIIVPIYKVELYLEKCIESILKQTLKEFELILVNDGSPDRCGDICEKYAEIDNRIKVIHKKNGGLSSARNSGLKIAEGKYVTFIDSDDWIAVDMYEKLYKYSEENSCDIAQCKFIRTNNETLVNCSNKITRVDIISNIEALKNLYNELYVQMVITCNKIYKRKLFNNITFPEGKIHEDEFTTYKLLYKANKIVLIDDSLYYYRQTPNSITNTPFSEKTLDYLDALNERLNFFEKIENEELYAKTLKQYEEVLRYYYFRCYGKVGNENSLDRINREHKLIFKKFIKNKDIKIKNKIIGLIFKVNPLMSKKIYGLICK